MVEPKNILLAGNIRRTRRRLETEVKKTKSFVKQTDLKVPPGSSSSSSLSKSHFNPIHL